MPRFYTKKTDRSFPDECLRQAVSDVIQNNISIRQSAEKNGVKKSRLAMHVKIAKIKGLDEMSFTPNFRQSQIFSCDMENALESYLLKCSSMFYGLTPNTVRRLAYEYALSNALDMPESWKKLQSAGKDWFWGFMKRHPKLSVRKPEATSLARMTSFNRTTVKGFQDKLQRLLERHKYEPSQIYNLDETGVSTVQKLPKVIGRKGEHQIGQATSRERGELITQVGVISASGNFLPPVWIFPRHRFDAARMMHGVSENGALGLVYPSGWMTSSNFLEVLKHLVKNTRCSVEHQILLILDNHESHLSLAGIEYCRSNGISILTLPPHTSNKLQPLDRTVFGPFKSFLSQGMNSWMLSNPGKTISIYDLPPLCAQAWDRAATPTNIKAGFRCTGILPFDRDIFTDKDFLSSYVTDRPNPDHSETVVDQQLNETIMNSPSTSNAQSSNFVSPEVLRPFPKAPERKEGKRGRQKGKCMIATDTPEKNEIAEKESRRKPKVEKIKVTKRKVLQTEEESDSEDDIEIEYKDNSSDDDEIFENDESTNTENFCEGDFIIARVFGKATIRNYAAKILKKGDEGYDVIFLKRHVVSNRFTEMMEDRALVAFSDVLYKLPTPLSDTRERFRNMLYFNEDLTHFSLQ